MTHSRTVSSPSVSTAISSAIIIACACFVPLHSVQAAPQTATVPAAGVLAARQTGNEKPVPPGATEKEIKLGEKAEADLAKSPQVKILDPAKDDQAKALYAKLNKMATELGKASARPNIVYKVKIIEDDQINAFTLPNGGIYFFTGLLDKLGSDDEIAAVMAHEISHNACMHVLRGQAKAGKMAWIGLAAMAAAMFGGKSGSDLASFSRYAMAGVMNSYSVQYEAEADTSAVEMMQKTSFNPSALVTVMERFEAEEKRRPKTELGIFQTHPGSQERAEAIEAQIRAAGLPFNPRAVSGAPQAIVVQGAGRVLVRFQDITLLEFADDRSTPAAEAAPAAAKPTISGNAKIMEVTPKADFKKPDSKSQKDAALKVNPSVPVVPAVLPITAPTSPVRARALDAAKALNALLAENLKLHEIKLQDVKADGISTVSVVARGTEIARVLPADAQLQNLSMQATAEKWRAGLRRIFWRESVNGAL